MNISKNYWGIAFVIGIICLLWIFRTDPHFISFFTGLGAFATVIYCIYTVSIVKATQASVDLLRLQSEEESRARITIVPYVTDSKIMISISNVGKLPASDLKMSLNSRISFGSGDTYLNDLPLVTRGVKAFQAGVSIKFFLGAGHEVMGRNEDEKVFSFRVEYKTGIGLQTHAEEIWIDLESWWMSDASRTDVDTAHIKTSKALEKIASQQK